MEKQYFYNSKSESGYALMLSIVVSSIVLSIGLSLFSIVQKELILSATGRDSQFAFYSADSGVECALYWDIKKLAFPSSYVDYTTNPPTSSCGKTDLTTSAANWQISVVDGLVTFVAAHDDGSGNIIPAAGYEDDIVTISFQVKFQDAVPDSSPGSCAKINITKTGNGQTSPTLYKVTTKIDSHGYNAVCPADGVFDAASNPALVERAISVQYGGD